MHILHLILTIIMTTFTWIQSAKYTRKYLSEIKYKKYDYSIIYVSMLLAIKFIIGLVVLYLI